MVRWSESNGAADELKGSFLLAPLWSHLPTVPLYSASVCICFRFIYTWSSARCGSAKRVLARVRDVEEPVLIFLLRINLTHQRCGGRQHISDKDENRFLWRQLDALPNDVDELADGEIGRNQVPETRRGGRMGGWSVRLSSASLACWRTVATHFFLSMSGMSLFSAFSQITGMRSGYFFRIRSASANRFSNVCS